MKINTQSIAVKVMLGTVNAIVKLLNQLDKGNFRYSVCCGQPTKADIESLTPRQLKRLDEQSAQRLASIRKHQTC